MYYITDYATKYDSPAHQILALTAAARDSQELQGKGNGSREFLVKAGNKLGTSANHVFLAFGFWSSLKNALYR